MFDQLGLVCARTSLGLRSPAPTRDRQQEKQHGTVKEAQMGNGAAAVNTNQGRNYIKYGESPKDQCKDGTDQA
jgi:hypothetical protein